MSKYNDELINKCLKTDWKKILEAKGYSYFVNGDYNLNLIGVRSADHSNEFILVPKTQNVPSNLPQGTVVRTPLSNTLVYASVHCSLLEQLDALSQIGGVCDLSYIKTPALLSRAENGKLTDAGNSMSPDIERVMSLNPDAILLSPFENARVSFST